MKSVDFVKMGFKNLWRRKLRTILTVVGVVIGTFSIIIMLYFPVLSVSIHQNGPSQPHQPVSYYPDNL